MPYQVAVDISRFCRVRPTLAPWWRVTDEGIPAQVVRAEAPEQRTVGFGGGYGQTVIQTRLAWLGMQISFAHGVKERLVREILSAALKNPKQIMSGTTVEVIAGKVTRALSIPELSEARCVGNEDLLATHLLFGSSLLEWAPAEIVEFVKVFPKTFVRYLEGKKRPICLTEEKKAELYVWILKQLDLKKSVKVMLELQRQANEADFIEQACQAMGDYYVLAFNENRLSLPDEAVAQLLCFPQARVVDHSLEGITGATILQSHREFTLKGRLALKELKAVVEQQFGIDIWAQFFAGYKTMVKDSVWLFCDEFDAEALANQIVRNLGMFLFSGDPYR